MRSPPALSERAVASRAARDERQDAGQQRVGERATTLGSFSGNGRDDAEPGHPVPEDEQHRDQSDEPREDREREQQGSGDRAVRADEACDFESDVLPEGAGEVQREQCRPVPPQELSGDADDSDHPSTLSITSRRSARALAWREERMPRPTR